MTSKQEHEYEIAAQLFNNNCNIQNEEQIKNIFRSLKLFISLNQSIYDRSDITLPRVFSFIALCNYKMGNYDRAYWCAKKSVELGEIAMSNSCFVCDTNLYLDPNVFELIEVLENQYDSDINFERGYIEGEENIYDDSFAQNLLKNVNFNATPSETEIKVLIEVISKVQKSGEQYFESIGDGMQAFQYGQIMESFKLPLFCAWQLYKYGWHTDFMKEGDSLLPYMIFESKALNMLQDLLDNLENNSPFEALEKNSAITNGLIRVYTCLLNDLKSGKVKL